ncbi:hypothetical protein [Cohnella nanjingensis]|uniref:hypothetical protein n=1 Tax=Cohnella nanjingensis TaxID=1387779 RepID=UPI001C86CEC3|nr:hypothetical protein [Cohnella nanjingensis]
MYKPLAFIGGIVSAASFIILAYAIGDFNKEIGKVIVMDIIALGCLLPAIVLRLYSNR